MASLLMNDNKAAVSRNQATQTGRQYLTFKLGQEPFAIPIKHIREIIEFSGLTQIPLLPAFLRGVINLRGAVVPVVDLAARFGRGNTDISRRTCIVIVELERDNKMVSLGVMVDTVNEVLSVQPGQIEPAPSFGAKIRSDFIEGMICAEEKFIIALSIQQVLAIDEMASLIGVATEFSSENLPAPNWP